MYVCERLCNVMGNVQNCCIAATDDMAFLFGFVRLHFRFEWVSMSKCIHANISKTILTKLICVNKSEQEKGNNNNSRVPFFLSEKVCIVKNAVFFVSCLCCFFQFFFSLEVETFRFFTVFWYFDLLCSFSLPSHGFTFPLKVGVKRKTHHRTFIKCMLNKFLV